MEGQCRRRERACAKCAKLVGGVATREIARGIGVTPSTVRNTLKRFQASGLSWPLPEMTDGELESKLFGVVGTKQGHQRHLELDWSCLHRELRRKHVTLAMLWEEYIEANPESYRYSRFCELFRSWEAKLSVTMRQIHIAGDKLFVDYAGDTVPVIVDRLTGEVRQAQIFVAVMGALNFTYVEATWTQTLIDWIDAHTRLSELNVAIGDLLRHLNDERKIRRLGVTRRQLFDQLDRPALRNLPAEPYVFAEWRVRRVGIDYHVDVAGHFYSVPRHFARAEVEVRLTGRTVEVFAQQCGVRANCRRLASVLGIALSRAASLGR